MGADILEFLAQGFTAHAGSVACAQWDGPAGVLIGHGIGRAIFIAWEPGALQCAL